MLRDRCWDNQGKYSDLGMYDNQMYNIRDYIAYSDALTRRDVSKAASRANQEMMVTRNNLTHTRPHLIFLFYYTTHFSPRF